MYSTTSNLVVNSQTPTGRPGGRRWSSVALLAGVLLSAAACNSESSTQPATVTTTPTPVSPTGPAAPVSAVSTTSVSTTRVPTAPVIPPTTTIAAIARPTATVDELVGNPGSRVHVRCVGQGDSTVVLIAGFGGDTRAWVKVEPALAARTRVCSYDRPGTGTSDPPVPAAIATFTTQATELHSLLETIGEPGPYVVVGHSFGGAEAVAYASLFSDDVAGLVLVDASPTTWPAALCGVADDGSDGAAMLRLMCSNAFAPTGNGEHLDVVTAFAEASDVASLDAMPIAVITATERELPADLAATERVRLTEEWNQGQLAWVALSTAAHLVSVDDTSHDIQIDQPAVVVDEITRLLPSP